MTVCLFSAGATIRSALRGVISKNILLPTIFSGGGKVISVMFKFYADILKKFHAMGDF